ncbi:MAG: hypothetical protein SW019_24500 [Actinomycetota bacterium]|nr:hypothetical protein [Actinomycetota bacterium]
MPGPGPRKSEEDVEDDPAVAASRDDGSYVGQVSGDDDFDAEESGAEARSQHG